MTRVKLALSSAALLGSLLMAVPEASAAPMPVAPVADAGATAAIQEARLVCGPFRCFRRRGFRHYFHRRFFHRHVFHRRFHRF